MATITQTVNTTTSASARVKTTTTVVATLAGLTSGGGSDPGNPTVYTTRTSALWTAPATVTRVAAVLVGGAGGPAWRTQGGAGAYAHVEGLPITGGLVYTLTPGTGGQKGGLGGTFVGGEPGGGDGGSGGAYHGGGGGGLTVILDPSDQELIVVGGGGGAGTTDAGAAGDRWGSGGAGGESGADGNNADATPSAYAGGGATPSAGGAGGTGAAGADGAAGTDLQGGVGGASVSNEGGGGGGGGWKGGGGGEAGSNGAGGGGGSSKLIASATAVTFSTGVGAQPVVVLADLLAGHGTNPDYSPNSSLSLLTGQSGAIRLYYNQVGDALPDWFLDDEILSFVWAPWEVSNPVLLAAMAQNGTLGHGDRVPYCTDWKGALHGHNSTVSGQPLIDYGGSSAAPDAEGWFEFSGSQRWQFNAGNAALPAGLRYFAVVEWTSGSSITLLELGNASSSSDAFVLGMGSASISTAVRQRRGGSNLDLQAQVSPVPTGLTTVEVITSPTSAGWVFEVNGVDETSVGPSGSVADRHAVGPLYYGARYNSTNPVYGYIKGWIIASADVDDAVWSAAKTWMTA